MNKHNPIGWFEIYVQDMPRAKAFYEAVFQTKLDSHQGNDEQGGALEMQIFPMQHEAYGSGGALVKMAGYPAGVMGGTLAYFTCTNCAVEAARAAEHGGKIFKQKFAIGENGFIALINDTEGNMIGLHSMQ